MKRRATGFCIEGVPRMGEGVPRKGEGPSPLEIKNMFIFNLDSGSLSNGLPPLQGSLWDRACTIKARLKLFAILTNLVNIQMACIREEPYRPPIVVKNPAAVSL